MEKQDVFSCPLPTSVRSWAQMGTWLGVMTSLKCGTFLLCASASPLAPGRSRAPG